MFKKTFIIIISVAIIFFLYVAIVNMNTLNLTGRQKIMKAIYPAITFAGRLFGMNADIIENKAGVKPIVSIYDITIELNDGSRQLLSFYKGRKILFVNTASDCGYTAQFDGLQNLYESFGDKLMIIGFPANDFKEQEKRTDAEIGAFCRKNYGVSFPLVKKGSVIRGSGQQPVYQWLTNKEKNGWNAKIPSWNFSKYLVNEEGVLTCYFGPSVEPDGEKLSNAINH
jgi:glutathione peroxidase